MSQGFCPALLRSINDIAEQNAPARKLQIAGLLAALFCCQNSSVSPVNDGFIGSQNIGLTVKYRQRPTLSNVSSTDDCNIDRIPSYQEWNLPGLGFKKSSFYISDDTMQRYCEDAIQMRRVGDPFATPVMQEIYDLLLEHANILLAAIDLDLVTQISTQAGVNVSTGQSNGEVINVNSDGNKLYLDNGIIQLMADLTINEICGDPCIVGNGLWLNWDRAQALACCNAAGQDLSRIGLPRFFYSKNSIPIWGPNTAFVLAPGSVKFLGRNKFVGPAFAGPRGASFFTTFNMPVNEFGCNVDDCLSQLKFDLQLRYIDCPTTISVQGQNQTVSRGWEAIVSKSYGLWVQPPNAYAQGDALYDTNGVLKYYLTNTGPTDPNVYAYGYGHP